MTSLQLPEATRSPSISERVRAHVASLEIADVISYEQSAKRAENSASESSDTGAGPEPDSELSVEARTRREGGLLETRFRIEVTRPDCEAAVDVGVLFNVDEDLEPLDSDEMRAFMSEVGIMAAYPYLREGVATSIARLGLKPTVLPIIRPGQIEFGTPASS